MNKVDSMEPGAAPTPHPPPRDTQLRTVLYVEDNPANRRLIERIFVRRPELQLLTAATGSAGVEIARTSRPGVILMDINLPDISGFKALALLRADPATAHIPVIALSANDMALNVTSGLEAGFFRYVTKPIDIKDFLATLDLALAFARQQSAKGN